MAASGKQAPAYSSTHFFTLAAARAGSQLLQFLIIAMLARALGVEEFGVYGLAISIASVLAMWVAFGINYMAVRDVAADPPSAPSVLKCGLLIRMLVLLPAVFLLIPPLYYAYSGHVRLAILVACGAIVLQVFCEFFCAILNGLGRLTLTAASWFGYHLLMASSYAAAVMLGARLATQMFAIRLLTGGALGLVLYLVVRHFVDKSIGCGAPALKKFAWRALPYCLLDVGGYLFITIDSVLLSLLQTPHALGCYQAAQRALLAVDGLSQAVALSILPTLSRLFATSREAWKITAVEYVRYVVMCAQPMGICMSLLGSPLVSLLFGSGYAEAGRVVSLFGLVVILRAANTALSNNLMASERVSVHTRAVWLSAGVQCVACYMLVRAHGIMGAAWAAVLATLVVTTRLSWAHRSVLSAAMPAAARLLKTILAGIVMAGTGFGARLWLNASASFFVALGAYLLLLAVTGEVGRRELDWLRQAISPGNAGRAQAPVSAKRASAGAAFTLETNGATERPPAGLR